jgi:hypothetical protein
MISRSRSLFFGYDDKVSAHEKRGIGAKNKADYKDSTFSSVNDISPTNLLIFSKLVGYVVKRYSSQNRLNSNFALCV